ncbi:hypothetical protein I3843_03G175900 [Carya illinoinensis]|nr:hypothetical protein I3843_03G175900 [Carya illinoinensis]
MCCSKSLRFSRSSPFSFSHRASPSVTNPASSLPFSHSLLISLLLALELLVFVRYSVGRRLCLCFVCDSHPRNPGTLPLTFKP